MLAPFALRRRTLSISCGTLSNSCGCGYMRLNGYFRYENHFSATKSAFTNILFLFEHLAGFAIYKSVELSSHQISLIIHVMITLYAIVDFIFIQLLFRALFLPQQERVT